MIKIHHHYSLHIPHLRKKPFSKTGITTNILEVDLCLGGDGGSMSLTLKWRWHERSATQVPQGLQ